MSRKSPALQSERLLLLLQQLKTEFERRTGKTGPKSGAVADVAKRTGLAESHASMILSQERYADQETINKIVAKMRIRFDFFTKSTLVNPSYLDFLEDSSVRHGDEPEPPSADEAGPYDYARAAAVFANVGATPREIRMLAGLSGLLRSRRDVRHALEALRGAKAGGETDERAVDAAAEAVENYNAAADAAEIKGRQPSSTPPAAAPKSKMPDRRRRSGS